MNRNKQTEFEFKLRIYLKYLNFNKYFYNYIMDIIKELNNTQSIDNKNINVLNKIISHMNILNRQKYINIEHIYTKEENINEFINRISIENMDNNILDKLLIHLNFINNK